MKNFFLAVLLIVTTSCSAQILGVNNLIARKTFRIGDWYVQGIQRDTTFNSHRYLPTSLAIKQFIEARLAAIPGASAPAVASIFGRTGAVTALETDYQSFYPRLSASYINPSWISSLDWNKLTGVPGGGNYIYRNPDSLQIGGFWLTGWSRIQGQGGTLSINSANNLYPLEVGGEIRVQGIRNPWNSNRITFDADFNHGMGLKFDDQSYLNFLMLSGNHYVQSLGNIPGRFIINAYNAAGGLELSTGGQPIFIKVGISEKVKFTDSAMFVNYLATGVGGGKKYMTIGENGKVDTTSSGGLTSETDPTVSAQIKAITAQNITDWNTTFGWGNHAAAGYTTSAQLALKLSLSDTAAMLSPYARQFNYYTKAVSDGRYLQSFVESDPTVSAAAKIISSADVSNWNGKENAANKAINLTTPDNIKYPSTQAVANALLAKVDTGARTNIYVQGGGIYNLNDSTIANRIVNATDTGSVTPAMKSAWDAKQAALVSGSNIKTVGGISILGSGDIPAGTAYTFVQSLVNNAGTVNLVGDVAAPGNNMVYGTNGTGARTFRASSVVDETGMATGDLVEKKADGTYGKKTPNWLLITDTAAMLSPYARSFNYYTKAASDGRYLQTLPIATPSVLGGVKVGSGLSADPAGLLKLGGTLDASTVTTIAGGNSSGLQLGGTGSKLTNLDIYTTGLIKILGARQEQAVVAGDVNFTPAGNDYVVFLPTITAARTLTMPSALGIGKSFLIANKNTSATFLWTFASTVKDLAGNVVTAIANNKSYYLVSDGTDFIIITF